MSERIPVNPHVLRWAREAAGLTVDDVVQRMKAKRVTAAAVLSWESGEDSPSSSQLERMAYSIYRRPLALFFFPEPPAEQTPRESFRTLPDYVLEGLPERIRFLIREARAMQLNLAELNDNINPAAQNILRDLSFDPRVTPVQMAASVRGYLQIDLATQSGWPNSGQAFDTWRDALEEHGVFVFKDAFRTESFSGFCLYDDQFPVIYVNNSESRNRQIFTLFHELAHLLFRTGGIDSSLGDHPVCLQGDNDRIEILCNGFTGEFLVPGHDLARRIEGLVINDESVRDLASIYHVSREVILRRLVAMGLVTQALYEEKTREWKQFAKKGSGGGGDYYNTIGTYLGHRYLQVAFGRYYQNRITADQLADYLGVKVQNLPGVEHLLFRRGATP